MGLVIKKHASQKRLKTNLYQLLNASVTVKGVRQSLTLLHPPELAKKLNESPATEFGTPQFAALMQPNLLIVYPRPDKRYSIHLVGTVVVEL